MIDADVSECVFAQLKVDCCTHHPFTKAAVVVRNRISTRAFAASSDKYYLFKENIYVRIRLLGWRVSLDWEWG